MKIMLIGSCWRADSFESCFKELGHEVLFLDWRKYGSRCPLISNFLNRFNDRYHYGLQTWRYNRDVLTQALNYRPDFMFFFRCTSVKESVYRKLAKAGIKYITYHNDDPFNNIPSFAYNRHYRDSLKYAIFNYVYRKKNIEDMKEIGVENVDILLPNYIRSKNFHIDGITKTIPVGFVGHFENDGRDKVIKAMIDAGIPVSIFGAWQKSPLYDEIKSVIHPNQYGAAYNETINRIRIALVFVSKHNHDTYTRRCFEIPVTKTMMLCEYTPDLAEMYPEGECAMFFRSPEEAVEKCQWLLDHHDEVERIGINGFERLMQLGGSELDRCRQIIEKVNYAL